MSPQRRDGTNPRALGTNPRAGGAGGGISKTEKQEQEQLLGKDFTKANPSTPPTPSSRSVQVRAALEQKIGYSQTNAERKELSLAVRDIAATGADGAEVRRRIAAWPPKWEAPAWNSVAKKWTYLGKLADLAEKPYPGLSATGAHAPNLDPADYQSVGEFLADNDVSSLRELMRRKS